MAVTQKYYGKFQLSVFNKEVDVNSDTIKLALFTSSLTINQDTHQYFDVTPYDANQVANGNGYTTGGYTVSPCTITYDAGTNKVNIDGADASWTSATFTCRYAILYDDTPVSSKPLIGYIDFGGDQVISNGTFSVAWDAAGIGYFQVA